MKHFLSCDWGTTALRMRLLSLPDLRVIAQAESQTSMVTVFSEWKASGKEEASRVGFYCAYLTAAIAKIEKQIGQTLNGVPVVLSGMASSSLGMKEVDYLTLPFDSRNVMLKYEKLSKTEAFAHDLLLISGLCSEEDIMRGEETQMEGVLAAYDPSTDPVYMIFPGTHSKHVKIVDCVATDIKTYMTGEVFSLLVKRSSLSNTLEAGGDLERPTNRKAFLNGVDKGMSEPFLHGAFTARINHLLRNTDRQANYFFLSGVLIGSELKSLASENDRLIYIVGEDTLNTAYELALEHLGFENIILRDGAEALSIGQFIVGQQARFLG